MNPSIFRSIIRSFLVTFCGMVGLGFGFLFLIGMVAALVTGVEDKFSVKSHFSPTILANANDTRKTLSDTAPVILKVNVNGIIGTDKLNMHTIQQQLTESREDVLKDNRVKAILIHINSPGGTVFDADGIYRSIKDYKERHNVPVYAYVDGLCASGGMYVASAADHIYASDISLIGSIGVISPSFFNFTQLMEKIGVEAKTLYAGKGKDDLNPFRPWREGEDESYKEIIEYYYDHFINVVASNRKEVSPNDLVETYGAHIFPADKALEIGLIDGANHSLSDVLKLLAKEIGIEDDYYQVIKLDRRFWLPEIMKDDSMVMKGTIKHQLEIPGELDPKLMNQFLYLYLPK